MSGQSSLIAFSVRVPVIPHLTTRCGVSDPEKLAKTFMRSPTLYLAALALCGAALPASSSMLSSQGTSFNGRTPEKVDRALETRVDPQRVKWQMTPNGRTAFKCATLRAKSTRFVSNSAGGGRTARVRLNHLEKKGSAASSVRVRTQRIEKHLHRLAPSLPRVGICPNAQRQPELVDPVVLADYRYVLPYPSGLI